MGDGKTSIRGGIGMFYSREILGAFILMSGNPPFGKLVSLYNTNLADPTGGSTLNYSLPTTLGSNDVNQLTPYTAQWNFNIQRALSSNWLLEIGYAGSKGVHMMRTQDVNQPLPSAAVANKTISANAVRPYPGFGVISQREQSYASKYHGLQTELTRRFAHGFLLKADYTWSKALDNTDCCSGNIYNYYPNAHNADLEWGRSSFDAEHNFIATYIYEIPFFHGRRDIAGQALGGWQLSGDHDDPDRAAYRSSGGHRSGRYRQFRPAASPSHRQSVPRPWSSYGRQMVRSHSVWNPGDRNVRHNRTQLPECSGH